jgi:hypothetical protein
MKEKDYEAIKLARLQERHKDLDRQIKFLEERHWPADYIAPYKKKKLSVKQELDKYTSNSSKTKESDALDEKSP